MLITAHNSFEASSYNATLEEEMARAENWSELLIEIIPANRIDDCFKRAFRDKPNDFPVNAYDLKNAWFKIEAEEAAEAARRQEAEKAENAIANCTNREHHVDDDRGKADEGLVAVYDPTNKTETVLPCWSCRPRAYAIRKAEIIESKMSLGVPKSMTAAIDAVTEEMSMNRQKPIQDDGRDLLGWFSSEFLKSYLATKPDEETGLRKFKYQLFGRIWYARFDEAELERIGVTIFHAADYIKLGAEAYAELKAKEEA